MERNGKSALCFNFGIGGTATYHQYLRYLTLSEKTHLDDVVLCFYPQNDVLNNHERLGKPFELPKSPYLVIRNGEFVEEKFPDADTTSINSRVSWLRSTVGTSFVATGMYRFIILLTTDAKKRKKGVWEERASWLGVYGEPLDEDWKEAWTITEETLLRFVKAAEERNSRFTLVIVADSLQIDPSMLDGKVAPTETSKVSKTSEVSSRLGEKVASRYDFEYPNRRLKQFCEKNGIVCLDSLPFFLERKRSLQPPYFSWEHDGHYSQLGHQTMADFLDSTGRFDSVK